MSKLYAAGGVTALGQQGKQRINPQAALAKQTQNGGQAAVKEAYAGMGLEISGLDQKTLKKALKKGVIKMQDVDGNGVIDQNDTAVFDTKNNASSRFTKKIKNAMESEEGAVVKINGEEKGALQTTTS